jgi:hypothetical protein
MTIALRAAVERLMDARSSRRRLAPFAETEGGPTLAEAHAIQEGLRAELDRRGERPTGRTRPRSGAGKRSPAA